MVCSLASVDYDRALGCLLGGGVLVFPTETFYALGCLSVHQDALAAVCALKERDPSKPLPLACASLEQLEHFVDGDFLENLHRYAPALFSFWPGPFTLLLPRRRDVCLDSCLLNGRGEMAVRLSAHPVVRALAQDAHSLLSVSSANLRGQPPVTEPNRLNPELLVRMAALDLPKALLVHKGNEAPRGGLPSTIVRPLFKGSTCVLELVREGAVNSDCLAARGFGLSSQSSPLSGLPGGQP